MQSGHLNLCIVPKITILTITPHPIEVFSLQPNSSPTPFIIPLGTFVEDSTEDIHLLFHDSVRAPVNPPTLGIPFQDPHVFSFEHQLGLPVSPLI